MIHLVDVLPNHEHYVYYCIY